MGAARPWSGKMTATLTTLGIVLAIAAEITVLQIEEKSLAQTQVSTTTSSLATSTTSGLHDVIFLVSGQCTPQTSGWTISEWGVTLGNTTKTYPLNATLSQIQSRSFVLGGNQSSITFAVPNGTYSYELYPNASEASQGPLEVVASPPGEEQAKGATGVITVSGFDLEFCLSYPAVVA